MCVVFWYIMWFALQNWTTSNTPSTRPVLLRVCASILHSKSHGVPQDTPSVEVKFFWLNVFFLSSAYKDYYHIQAHARKTNLSHREPPKTGTRPFCKSVMDILQTTALDPGIMLARAESINEYLLPDNTIRIDVTVWQMETFWQIGKIASNLFCSKSFLTVWKRNKTNTK